MNRAVCNEGAGGGPADPDDRWDPLRDCLLPGARQGRDPDRALKRGPRRVPPESVAARQRERLYDGLVHTVAEKGYANARVTDICYAAGVTRPVFYTLFDGKEDAFLTTYRHGTAVLLAAMAEAYDREPDWEAAVGAALAALLEVLARVPAFAAMAIVEIEAVGPAGRAARRELLGRFHRFFADAPRPAPPVDAERLVAAVVGGVHAELYEAVATGRTGELPERAGELGYFLLAPFLGPTAAAARLGPRASGPARRAHPGAEAQTP